MSKTDHAERTADQPREHVSNQSRLSNMGWDISFTDNPFLGQSLHSVILKQVDEIGQSVRLFRLEIPVTVGSIKVRWSQNHP